MGFTKRENFTRFNKSVFSKGLMRKGVLITLVFSNLFPQKVGQRFNFYPALQMTEITELIDGSQQIAVIC